MKVTILYDNEANPGLKPGWGFSCLIENKEKLLFDTGGSGRILMDNMEKLNVEPKDIATVVISHDHWDHNGGLKTLLKVNDKPRVFHPESFSKPTGISLGIYSTGVLGRLIKEQSLVTHTEKGNVVITGCAHPGLGNILEKAKQLGKIYGVVRGFHGGFAKLDKLNGLELITPCHCTQYKQEIKERYPGEFKEIKAGSIIEI